MVIILLFFTFCDESKESNYKFAQTLEHEIKYFTQNLIDAHIVCQLIFFVISS